MPAERPHILWLPSFYPTPSFPFLGNFFLEHIKLLRKAGWNIGVIYPDICGLSRIPDTTLRTHHFKPIIQYKQGFPEVYLQGINPFPGLGLSLWKHATRWLYHLYVQHVGKPDFIHVQSAIWAGWGALHLKKRYGIPYVITEHRGVLTPHAQAHLSPLRKKRLLRMKRLVPIYQQATRVGCVSNSISTFLKTLGLVAHADYLPNYVDTTFFHPPLYSPPSSPFRFLTVCDLRPIKGLDILLKAFQQLHHSYPDIHLTIVGDGPEKSRLKATVASLGLSDKISWTGNIPHEEVRNHMQKAHVLVLPSRYESFGIVLIEAMATGLPVIATHSGGPIEIVHPSTGWLIPPDQPDILTQTMQQAIVRYPEIDRQAIRKYAVENFSEKQWLHRISTFYTHTMKTLAV